MWNLSGITRRPVERPRRSSTMIVSLRPRITFEGGSRMSTVFPGQLRDQRLTALGVLRLGEPDAPEIRANPPGERLLEEIIQPPDQRSLPVRDVDRGMKRVDRKSTRLNSSHGYISYAVF